MINHALFRRAVLTPAEVAGLHCDLFMSALNDSARVRAVHRAVNAVRKIWLVHEEYGYAQSELPSGELYAPVDVDGEASWWLGLIERHLVGTSPDAHVIVDITGMMRPHIMVMPLILRALGLAKLTVLYTDPTSYMAGSRTTFSRGSVLDVRQVQALEGAHVSATSGDVLVLGAGYDHELIRAVAEAKRNCRHLVVLGLPSLQPHMYQESQMRLAEAAESLNRFAESSLLFAPADDPFATAAVLQQKVAEYESRHPGMNLYLSPLGPKTQVLGFAWYFLTERMNGASSMLFPFKPAYSRETSVGFSRVHRFELELACIPDD